MSEMVERVAKAIEPAAFHRFESLRSFCLRKGDDEAEALCAAEWAHGQEVREAMEKARAAIEAMRSLPDCLDRQGWALSKDFVRDYPLAIDAALSEVEG